MATNVVMPQMGESVTEGTITRWIKKVGDLVDRDEPLFEISTDKVDAEIPAPAGGVLIAIHVAEGQTVDVDTVVALIGEASDLAESARGAAPITSRAAHASASAPAITPPPPAPQPTPSSVAPPPPSAVAGTAAAARSEGVAPSPGPTQPASGSRPATGAISSPGLPSSDDALAQLRRRKSSPLVRRIAQAHGIDLTRLRGSGISGRVTKQDIMRVVNGVASPAVVDARPSEVVGHRPDFDSGADTDVVPMSVMRKRIAEHMIHSRRTSAHVHSVIEVDYTRVAAIRAAKKAEYERAGAKLTFLSFIARSVVGALRKVPVLNASIEGDSIIYRRDINLGIAVALDWGLIVPVVKHADGKSLLTISQEVADLAARARTKHLKPEDVQGGTFTITNPGGFGTLVGFPIINQPQVGILAVGSIEKRVVVVEHDAIAIRQRGLLSLGFDHRLVDGAVADAFLAEVKRGLEQYDSSAD